MHIEKFSLYNTVSISDISAEVTVAVLWFKEPDVVGQIPKSSGCPKFLVPGWWKWLEIILGRGGCVGSSVPEEERLIMTSSSSWKKISELIQGMAVWVMENSKEGLKNRIMIVFK